MLSHLAVMVAVAAILGVVVAGLAIPFAGVVGIAARDVGQVAWTTCPPSSRPRRSRSAPGSSTPTATLIATLYDENRVNVPLEPGLAR